MYEEYERSSIEAGVSTGMTELVTKEVEEVEQAVKHSSISYFMLNLLPYSRRALNIIRSNRVISSNICVILGHGQCGGMREYQSVLILIFRPENINTIFSIQPL